jgi:hypothetical protein
MHPLVAAVLLRVCGAYTFLERIAATLEAKNCHDELLPGRMIKTICKVATLNAALVFSPALVGANEIAPEAPAQNGQIESSDLLAPTCERAKNAIVSKGFKEIQTIDCTGDFYVFHGLAA